MKRILASFRRNRNNDVDERFVVTERKNRKECEADQWFWWPLMLPNQVD
ncbi:MAG: hypothetical protein K2X77_23620 [Candidatus Obscuribacterales bacterium]|jgi:hypothetical protein|nr:hypothetical protein [Candidatus Obscuribacterales bacterium]